MSSMNGTTALFVYPEDLRGPRWTERVVEKIDHAGQRRVAQAFAS
jgi:hypothetical protein